MSKLVSVYSKRIPREVKNFGCDFGKSVECLSLLKSDLKETSLCLVSNVLLTRRNWHHFQICSDMGQCSLPEAQVVWNESQRKEVKEKSTLNLCVGPHAKFYVVF